MLSDQPVARTGLRKKPSRTKFSETSATPYTFTLPKPDDHTNSNLVVWATIAAEWNDSEDENAGGYGGF